jgi:ribosomal protein S18 acetylase RimI-like enzyme
MPAKPRSRVAGVRIRKGRLSDMDALMSLEHRVFTVDQLSRKSFRNFLTSPHSVLMVAEEKGAIVGYVHVLFRPRSVAARLYSLGVTPEVTGRGIGIALLRAGEDAARKRKAPVIRLEVQPANRAAIARYEKSGYRATARLPGYYNDGSDALRYEKTLRQEKAPGRAA